MEYDIIGSIVTVVKSEGVSKAVEPLLYIEECKGIIVKKNEKYGVLDLKGSEIIPIVVDYIYAVENEHNEMEYIMLHNRKEINIIEALIEVGVIEKPKEEEKNEVVQNNNIELTPNANS